MTARDWCGSLRFPRTPTELLGKWKLCWKNFWNILNFAFGPEWVWGCMLGVGTHSSRCHHPFVRQNGRVRRCPETSLAQLHPTPVTWRLLQTCNTLTLHPQAAVRVWPEPRSSALSSGASFYSCAGPQKSLEKEHRVPTLQENYPEDISMHTQGHLAPCDQLWIKVRICCLQYYIFIYNKMYLLQLK